MAFLDWLRRRKRRKLGDGWSLVEGPRGARVIMDSAVADYLASEPPDPTQETLDGLFAEAREVHVIAGGAASGDPLGHHILFTSREPKDLHELRVALQIVPGGAGHCMCHGDLALVFADAHGSRLGVIGVHHGQSIRWDRWKDDAALQDGDRLLDWLTEHGVRPPLNEAQLRQRSVRRVERNLGTRFQVAGRGSYRSEDGAVALILACAPPQESGESQRYHFAVRGDQLSQVQEAPRSYVGLVCGGPDRVFLVPFEDFARLVMDPSTSIPADAAHFYPLVIREESDSTALEAPASERELDATLFLVP